MIVLKFEPKTIIIGNEAFDIYIKDINDFMELSIKIKQYRYLKDIYQEVEEEALETKDYLIGEDDIRRFLGKKGDDKSLAGETAKVLAETFGIVLQNDESAYIKEISELRRKLEIYELNDISKYVSSLDSIQDIIHSIRNLLWTYESSERFNYIPKTKIMGYDFYNEWFEKLKEAVYKVSIGKPELHEKLERILKETESFVKRFEVPGVVDRWIDINPRINFYHVAYDLIEESPDAYETLKNGNQKIKLSLYPTDEQIKSQKEYFKNLDEENKRHNTRHTRDYYFIDELVRTFTKVCNHDLQAYL